MIHALRRVFLSDPRRKALGKRAVQGSPGAGDVRFDQRREPLPRKAMVVVVVISRIPRKRGMRQSDKGLQEELALETPAAAACTRSG